MLYAGPKWAIRSPTRRQATMRNRSGRRSSSDERPPAGTGAPYVEHSSGIWAIALVPFQPAPDISLLDLNNSHETPAEEFRTLRTR